MTDLPLIVVSYHTRRLTCACLAAGADMAEVFVVDNASTDGSAEANRERFPVAVLARRQARTGPVRR